MFRLTLLTFYGTVTFSCSNLTISDDDRQVALDLINYVRRQIARGTLSFPTTSNMNRLRWDCNLEAMAQAAILNCPQDAPTAPELNGLNYLNISAVEGPFAIVERALLIWNDRGNSWPRGSTVYNGHPELLSFANMIRTTTTAVGCSGIKCGERHATACFFSHPNVKPGTSVYTHENLVTVPSSTTASPSTAESAMTKEPPSTTGSVTTREPLTVIATNTTTELRTVTVPSSTTASPSTAESAMTKEPSSTTGTLTTREPSTVIAPNTTTELRTVTVSNTTSAPLSTTTTRRKSTDCPSRAFSSAYRETALGMHNNFRSLVARGLAVNAEHQGEFAPPSSRMDVLNYDCCAEAYAHTSVRSCSGRKSSPYTRPGLPGKRPCSSKNCY